MFILVIALLVGGSVGAPAGNCRAVCSYNYSPICASSGQTYFSNCHLNRAICHNAGVLLKYEYTGECRRADYCATGDKCVGLDKTLSEAPAVGPFCASDGRTYNTACDIDKENCRLTNGRDNGKIISIVFHGVCQGHNYNDYPGNQGNQFEQRNYPPINQHVNQYPRGNYRTLPQVNQYVPYRSYDQAPRAQNGYQHGLQYVPNSNQEHQQRPNGPENGQQYDRDQQYPEQRYDRNQQYPDQQYDRNQQYPEQQYDRDQQYPEQQYDQNQQYDGQQYSSQELDRNQQYDGNQDSSQQYDENQDSSQQYDENQHHGQQYDGNQFQGQQYNGNQHQGQQYDGNQNDVGQHYDQNQQETAGQYVECPDACPHIYQPVCGSDGNTYANACELQAQNCRFVIRLVVDYEGPCSRTGVQPPIGPTVEPPIPPLVHLPCPLCIEEYNPVCGSDGYTYNSQCLLDVRACRTGGSLKAVHPGPCKQPSGSQKGNTKNK